MRLFLVLATALGLATTPAFAQNSSPNEAQFELYSTPQQTLHAWIEEQLPGYSQRAPEQRALALLQFTSTNIDSAFDGGYIYDARPVSEPSQAFHQWPADLQILAFERNYPGGGMNCAGFATVLSLLIMELEGWPVWRVDMADGVAAHTVVLTEVTPGKVIVLDALFGHYYANASGAAMKLEDITSALQRRRASQVHFTQPGPVSREAWMSANFEVRSAVSAPAECHLTRRSGLGALQICQIENWSLEAVGPMTIYGSAVAQYLVDAQLPNDPRYLLLTSHTLTHTSTAERASPEARAAVADLIRASERPANATHP